ncbi:aminodeoxychorismate synthase component I [Brevibacillus laterosporus]|uniref:aminodeoxychorismate synthase component I n=1 Tax=Brevibacillus laterosporus TaxID=1465 RepID=UPI001F0FA16C|nr:aminodeoxychorismate synthase component I [Brevibacillus laterosporus]WNX29351.1 aminodeoxychorismate synthase component I [Brevibacillus laterosporus]
MCILSNIPLHSIVPQGIFRKKTDTLPTVKVISRKITMYVEPERVFFHLFSTEAYTYWLDSSRVESNLSRFSFMGTNDGPLSQVISYETATKQIKIKHSTGQAEITESIFDYLDRQLYTMQQESAELPFDFNGGFVGYFGYELKAECGAKIRHTATTPDAMFIYSDRMIAFDHQEKCIYLVSIVPSNEPASADQWFENMEQKLKNLPLQPALEIPNTDGNQPLSFQLSQSYSQYVDHIQACKQYILDGETYEICLTNRIRTQESFDPVLTYRILREINPAPYSAFFKFNDLSVLCSSPERFLKIDQNRLVETKPIKGTIGRSSDPEEDMRLKEQLRSSEKDRAENLMIVDLLRNDLGLVCETGSVCVPKLMAIESYQTVHQMVSTIQGTLRPELSAIDCIRAAFPGGSMTGAPKLRTMKFIDELETDARGIYSGAIGFLGLNGTIDLNVVIRTIVMSPQSTTVGVGGAIVSLSDPEQEFEEILLKGHALIKALTISRYGKFDEQLWTLHDTNA